MSVPRFQLLGSEVYASNNQLGGVQIMYKNGVSHDVCGQDFDGICTLLRWLSYVPRVSRLDTDSGRVLRQLSPSSFLVGRLNRTVEVEDMSHTVI